MSRYRLTIDEIGPDRHGEQLATLVDDAGRSVVLPVDLLPEGAKVGNVLGLTLERDAAETEQRASHVAELQRRLFGPRKRQGPTAG